MSGARRVEEGVDVSNCTLGNGVRGYNSIGVERHVQCRSNKFSGSHRAQVRGVKSKGKVL